MTAVYLQNEDALKARLLRDVVQNAATGCWLWVGAKNAAGYGRISYGGRQGYPHRLAYELWVGPIPAGLEIDHLCRVRACVNPTHLEAVTHAENQRRVVERGSVARGSAHGHARLSTSDVLEIDRALTEGVPKRNLADRYRVSWQAIHSIEQGISWGHLTGRRPRPRYRRPTRAQRDQAIAWLQAGGRPKDIVRWLGVSFSTVLRWRKQVSPVSPPTSGDGEGMQ